MLALAWRFMSATSGFVSPCMIWNTPIFGANRVDPTMVRDFDRLPSFTSDSTEPKEVRIPKTNQTDSYFILQMIVLKIEIRARHGKL